MINKVFLIGNLGKDPEVRHLEGGTTVARFPVATNESYLDKNQQWQTLTEWHDVVVWRRLAERAEKQLKKGSFVFIEGKITHRKWQDRDGNDRYSTEIVAQTFRLLDRKDGGSQEPDQPSEKEYLETSNASSGDNDTLSDADDDLPF